MGKVINLNPALTPDEVLKESAGEYKDVLVIGYNKDGVLDVRCNYGVTGERALFMLEQFKHKLMRGDYQHDE